VLPDDLPALPYGELAPAFDLPDRTGARVTRSQFRGRQILVLLFVPEAAVPELRLSELDAQRERLEWLETTILVILPVPTSALPVSQAPIRYLADPGLTVTRNFTPVMEERPLETVVVLDRYGAVEQRWLAPHLPSAQDVFALVERLALSCSG